MDDSQQGSRPTAWIIATVALAIAAVGFAIWGFTTKSDLDDANATIDKQKTQLAAQSGEASQTERRLTAFGDRERAAFRRVRRRYIGEETKAGQLKQNIQKEAADVQDARKQTAAAQSQDEKERGGAEAGSAGESAEKPRVCRARSAHSTSSSTHPTRERGAGRRWRSSSRYRSSVSRPTERHRMRKGLVTRHIRNHQIGSRHDS